MSLSRRLLRDDSPPPLAELEEHLVNRQQDGFAWTELNRPFKIGKPQKNCIYWLILPLALKNKSPQIFQDHHIIELEISLYTSH